MAKFSRFDPRNKKRSRHKYQSLNRDIRIKEKQKSKKGYVLSDEYVVGYTSNEGDIHDEQLEQGDPHRL